VAGAQLDHQLLSLLLLGDLFRADADTSQCLELLFANDVLLVEDDAYGMLEPSAVPLAPSFSNAHDLPQVFPSASRLAYACHFS
jgi:hypothetical protein